MDASDFIKLVRRLREAQIAYFAQRTQSNLIAAKGIEQEVDRALVRGVTVLHDTGKGMPEAMIVKADGFYPKEKNGRC